LYSGPDVAIVVENPLHYSCVDQSVFHFPDFVRETLDPKVVFIGLFLV
jgi:hypothetical protein